MNEQEYIKDYIKNAFSRSEFPFHIYLYRPIKNSLYYIFIDIGLLINK